MNGDRLLGATAVTWARDEYSWHWEAGGAGGSISEELGRLKGLPADPYL